MNIANTTLWKKYSKKWSVKTTTNAKDSFGGMEVSSTTKDVMGRLSKSMTSNSQDGATIPTTQSGGVFFTLPETILITGDILDNQYQIIDFDYFPSHNEYRLKFIDKWGA